MAADTLWSTSATRWRCHSGLGDVRGEVIQGHGSGGERSRLAVLGRCSHAAISDTFFAEVARDHLDAEQKRTNHDMNMHFRMSTQISRIDAKAPWRRLQRRTWRAPRAREGGPAPIRKICADLRKLTLVRLFVPWGEIGFTPGAPGGRAPRRSRRAPLAGSRAAVQQDLGPADHGAAADEDADGALAGRRRPPRNKAFAISFQMVRFTIPPLQKSRHALCSVTCRKQIIRAARLQCQDCWLREPVPI
ncbi:unnamed protein product [Prorocentrum cordatum]|nr:unnamed protein product [Polarella glacialis]